MKVDLNRVITIDALIRQKSTGSPDRLAEHLKISRRTLFDTLNFMREQLDAPIVYSKVRRTYVYQDQGSLNFKYKKVEGKAVK
uniref:hypothetical protein n=1 Tax=Pedobacter schmidteae TaxID=2201271 RepID=UPI000EB5A8B7|nr:hypothetical protein [Pedobacter schmidteae]